MAAPRRRGARPWWRAPVLQRATRRGADVVLALSAAVALACGTGAAATVDALTTPQAPSVAVPTRAAELGPVTIDLPADVGPWTRASDTALAALRQGEVDDAWGMVAPGSVVVTVLVTGDHGGVAEVDLPGEDPALWAGERAHTAGLRVTGEVRELVLVAESGDGALVVLSVSGPPEAFASGSLAEAFRTARVG